MDALGGIVALHHGAHFRHGLLGRLALADENAGPVVPGVHGGAGDDQIPHAGKAAEGPPGTAQLLAQVGQLRHGPGHQQRLGVVLETQTRADAAAQGHYVLQRRRQLHAHDVVAGVDAEIVVHERVLDEPSRRPVRAGGNASRGHPDAHLFRVGGAGQGHHPAEVMGLLLDHLAHAQIGVPLNALGDGHQDGLPFQVGRHLPGGLPDGEGGCRADHQVRPLQTGEVTGDLQRLRQDHTLEQGIFPGLLHLRRLGRVMGPEPGIVSVVAEDLAQGRAPAAAAHDHSFHVFPSRFGCRLNLFSFPWSSRRILPRCCQTTSPPMIKARTTMEK